MALPPKYRVYNPFGVVSNASFAETVCHKAENHYAQTGPVAERGIVIDGSCCVSET